MSSILIVKHLGGGLLGDVGKEGRKEEEREEIRDKGEERI